MTPMRTALATSRERADSALRAALRNNWPEYFIEGFALGLFMLSACIFGVLLEHPNSPLNSLLVNSDDVRRALGGAAMGLTAIGIFYSPWGQRSGAHMNPAVTLTFLSLGKIAPWDAFFYIVFQFLGGIAGVYLAGVLIGLPLQHAAVNYVITVPGASGVRGAFAGEFVIAALMMSTVLWVSNSKKTSRFTPIFAGFLIAAFITFEAPLSGMSMNPARTVASALSAGEWTAVWIYFVAPALAMLTASLLYRSRRGVQAVFCAKFHHDKNKPCIFKCRYGDLHAK
jgi:aquaporin Z